MRRNVLDWVSHCLQRGRSRLPRAFSSPSSSAVRIAIAVGAFALASAAAADLHAAGNLPLEPSAIFANKCSSCHTFGKGERIGPDLKGATARHAKAWLIAWIRSSEQLIKAGDRAATELFAKYKRQRMPDHELSEAEIVSLIEYLDHSGPEADEQHAIRVAASATADEVERGRKLFYGSAPLASGSLACAACHALSHEVTGATFGPSLGRVFTRYQDKALDVRLSQPCLRSSSIKNARVNDTESLALRGFLRSIELQDLRTKMPPVSAVAPAAGTPVRSGEARENR
jgi:cytochrome c2